MGTKLEHIVNKYLGQRYKGRGKIVPYSNKMVLIYPESNFDLLSSSYIVAAIDAFCSVGISVLFMRWMLHCNINNTNIGVEKCPGKSGYGIHYQKPEVPPDFMTQFVAQVVGHDIELTLYPTMRSIGPEMFNW